MGGTKTNEEDAAQVIPTASEGAEAVPTLSEGAESINDTANEEVTEVSVPSIPQASGRHESRHRLLMALKPYVSTGRGRALESMEAIADIFEMIRS